MSILCREVTSGEREKLLNQKKGDTGENPIAIGHYDYFIGNYFFSFNELLALPCLS